MNPSITLRARWIIPVEGKPIADGKIVIEAGKITALGTDVGRTADIDLGNVAILPGFVNAHTHLELSDIEPAGNLPEPELDWLRRVIAFRRNTTPVDLLVNIKQNLDASLRAGTTLIADTTSAGASWPSIAAAPVRGVVFAEIIGLKRMRGVETEAVASDWLMSITAEDQERTRCRPGLSPHAPYSTAGWLYNKSAQAGVPLSTHLAEMPEEHEFLGYRRGGLRTFLEEIGAWDPDFDPIGPNPADYVRKGNLREADWIIAHGTYLTESDFWQLRPQAAPAGQRVAVAYCPRTHARFGHARHPFREMLAQGAIVCLGTDSLASSPTLGILDEIRFLATQDPSLTGPTLLSMATLFGAWALRADHVAGSLKIGKSADLAIVSLPDRDDDPYQLLLQSNEPVVGTVFEGKLIRGELPGGSF